MSRIRSRDTKPEVLFRRLLFGRGLRGYRLHVKLPGRPDIVFSRKKLVVFIDGCFWHGCPRCSDGRAPVSNTSYWAAKRESNRLRDLSRTSELRRAGWTVIRLWEHDILKRPDVCIRRIEKKL